MTKSEHREYARKWARNHPLSAEKRKKHNLYVREWRKANYKKFRKVQKDGALRRKYGITLTEYSVLVKAQKGRCAICGGKPSKAGLCVDHDHRTQEVRGLLCNKCNRALGLFGDNAKTLKRAILYLQ